MQRRAPPIPIPYTHPPVHPPLFASQFYIETCCIATFITPQDLQDLTSVFLANSVTFDFDFRFSVQSRFSVSVSVASHPFKDGLTAPPSPSLSTIHWSFFSEFRFLVLKCLQNWTTETEGNETRIIIISVTCDNCFNFDINFRLFSRKETKSKKQNKTKELW